jgi:hypothetical protein
MRACPKRRRSEHEPFDRLGHETHDKARMNTRVEESETKRPCQMVALIFQMHEALSNQAFVFFVDHPSASSRLTRPFHRAASVDYTPRPAGTPLKRGLRQTKVPSWRGVARSDGGCRCNMDRCGIFRLSRHHAGATAKYSVCGRGALTPRGNAWRNLDQRGEGTPPAFDYSGASSLAWAKIPC